MFMESKLRKAISFMHSNEIHRFLNEIDFDRVNPKIVFFLRENILIIYYYHFHCFAKSMFCKFLLVIN